MAGFVFSEERALNADRGGYITAGGVFVGVITEMVAFKKESGSAGVELSFETITGEKCNFVSIYTTNRDGSDNFAKGKIDSAVGILGLKELPINKVGEKITFPSICNKRIAFALQREDYIKEDQKTIGWKMNLLHFFYPDTLQTYREKREGLEALTSKRKIVDALIESGGTEVEGKDPVAASMGISDDDCPF